MKRNTISIVGLLLTIILSLIFVQTNNTQHIHEDDAANENNVLASVVADLLANTDIRNMLQHYETEESRQILVVGDKWPLDFPKQINGLTVTRVTDLKKIDSDRNIFRLIIILKEMSFDVKKQHWLDKGYPTGPIELSLKSVEYRNYLTFYYDYIINNGKVEVSFSGAIR